jgi:hypothetical protein
VQQIYQLLQANSIARGDSIRVASPQRWAQNYAVAIGVIPGSDIRLLLLSLFVGSYHTYYLTVPGCVQVCVLNSGRQSVQVGGKDGSQADLAQHPNNVLRQVEALPYVGRRKRFILPLGY